MNKKAKCLIILFSLVIVFVVIFLCYTYAKGSNNVLCNSDTYTVNENVTNGAENNIYNKEIMEEKNTVANKTTEEKTKEQQTTENINEQAKSGNSELEHSDDETKAIQIVKKDWGDTDGFSFKVEQIGGDGSYIISVRNEDAIALEWYTVYPETGKFTK